MRCISSWSPGMMPTSRMESPLTSAMYIASLMAMSSGRRMLSFVVMSPGLVGNPAMFYPGATAQTIRQFHDTLLETYIETFGSARNAIFRLKENWHCMIMLFEDSEKLWKKLRKTTDIEEYRAITAEIFATLPMRGELQADW